MKSRTPEAALEELEAWCRARDWRGSDPYEGLNATRTGPLGRSPLGRRLLIQLVKRSPLDLRRPLGIEPRHNAAAIAHALSGYCRAGGLDPELRQGQIDGLLAKLDALRLDCDEGPCWGYHFDVQTRFFFYSARTPNSIATAFAGFALLDAAALAGRADALEVASGVADFLLAQIPRVEAEAGAYFGYLPGDRTPIHNASLLVAALLAEVAEAADRPELREPARAAADYAIAHQRPDGSWPYAETTSGDWIDGFHTGYVLDALRRLADSLPEGAGIEAAWQRGLRFYAEQLFDPDGAPRYFTDNLYPIDSQSVAQAITTFSIASEHDPAWLDRALATFGFAERRMRRRDGAYMFQRRALWRNPAPHMRWVQAPMFEALARLSAARSLAK